MWLAENNSTNKKLKIKDQTYANNNNFANKEGWIPPEIHKRPIKRPRPKPSEDLVTAESELDALLLNFVNTQITDKV